MGCDAIQAVSGNHGKLRGEPGKGDLGYSKLAPQAASRDLEVIDFG